MLQRMSCWGDGPSSSRPGRKWCFGKKKKKAEIQPDASTEGGVCICAACHTHTQIGPFPGLGIYWILFGSWDEQWVPAERADLQKETMTGFNISHCFISLNNLTCITLHCAASCSCSAPCLYPRDFSFPWVGCHWARFPASPALYAAVYMGDWGS